MPVIDHPTHPDTVGGALYGCHNRNPFNEGYFAPNGYSEVEGNAETGLSARMKISFIPHEMSRDCRYDMSLTDPKCEGCKHRGSGEDYTRSVVAGCI